MPAGTDHKDMIETMYVPEPFMEAEDSEFTLGERQSFHKIDNQYGGQLGLYYGNTEVQEGILAHQHAAERLYYEKPHLFNALAASAILQKHVTRTPLVPATDAGTQEIFVKQEYLQQGKSFKDRGAAYAALQLSDAEKVFGLKTTSHGNHGNGLARIGKELGVPVAVYVPADAAACKTANMEVNGAEVVRVGKTYEEAELACVNPDGRHADARLVRAFNDQDVMTGQSSIVVDIVEQVPDVQTLVVPIGGGGLISKLSAAFKEYNPHGTVVGAVYAGNNSARLSKEAGKIVNIGHGDPFSDGTELVEPGSETFPYIQKYVDAVVEVSKESVSEAMARHFDTYGHRVEVAGMLATAAALENPGLLRGKTVTIATGCNIDDADWNEAMQAADRPDLYVGRVLQRA